MELKPANLRDAVEPDFVFRSYPTPAPGAHHRPRKKVHSRPHQDPHRHLPSEYKPTNTRQKPAGERTRDTVNRRARLADLMSTTSQQSNFTSDGLMPMERKYSGFFAVTLEIKENNSSPPTSVLVSDSPEDVAAVPFPTRCWAQLAEVNSYSSGRCPSP